MNHGDHERDAQVCDTCARVGRSEALTEARDVAADYERDARECISRARAPDKQAMRQRLEVATKVREGIERLANAPPPLRPPTESQESNVVPIGRPRRRK